MNITTNSTGDLQEMKSCSASQVALADCYMTGRLVQALGIRSLHSATIINHISLHRIACMMSYFPYGVIVDKMGPKVSTGLGECFLVCLFPRARRYDVSLICDCVVQAQLSHSSGAFC